MVYKIKELRQQKGITQKELSKHLGIAQNTLSYWENGRIDIDTESLCKIADYFNVSVDYLLGRENKKQSQGNISSYKLSEHEKDIITAYRSKKVMQPAVDRLLEVQQGESDGAAAYIAAHGKNSKGGATIHLSADELEKLNKAPETNEDF